MNREQFLDALAVLVQRHEETDGAVGISQAEAADLIQLYDGGAIDPDQLPLPFDEATRGPQAQLTLDRAAETVAVEAASMATIEQTGVVPAAALNAAQESRTRIAQEAMEVFDRDVRSLAQDVVEGSIRGRDWHSQMLVNLRQHLLQQAQLGKGSPLTPDEISALQDVMREEAEFLKRFADEVAARNELADSAEEVAQQRLEREARREAREQLQEAGEEVTEEAVGELVEEPSEEAIEELAEDLRGRPMTEDEIAARARQYKGSAYEQFWRKSEEQVESNDTVIDYVSQDDGRTCQPCRAAEDGGPYLPGRGPMPGGVCLGGGHCRCVRERRTDAEMAATLRGE
jgi:hypothetical protein